MRLKTKLVLAATVLTFAIVLVLSALFLGELLRQRIEQTASANDVLVHEVWLETRKAVETGLRANPPVDKSDAALHEAVVNALRSQTALSDVMNTIVRYSPTVQDVSVTDAHGMTLVSTDPDAINQREIFRFGLKSLQGGGMERQIRVVFGKARVSCGSAKRPCASACQISSMQSGTGAPSPSNTRPFTQMRSPDTSGVIRLLVKASFQSYWPFGVRPYLKNGPTVCDGVRPFVTYFASIGVASRPRNTMLKR